MLSTFHLGHAVSPPLKLQPLNLSLRFSFSIAMVFPPSDEYFCSDHPVAEEAYNQLADVFTNVRKINHSEFFSIEKPELLMVGNLQKERQISVDPISMKEPRKLPPFIASPTKEFGKLLPVATSPKDYGMPPLPLPPGKSRFLSYSLPGSPKFSSPKFSSAILKKKTQSQTLNPLPRQQSVALSRLAQLRENHLQRSKSLGEPRASAVNDEFDLWLTNADSRRYSNPSRTERVTDREVGRQEMLDSYDDDFKCGTMCLFLPSFGKGKPVKSRKDEHNTPDRISRTSSPDTLHAISRTVSLERFECGSWTYSDHSDSSKFFDLPMELIQCSENDADLPVRTAFVFEKDRKGALKKGVPKGTSRNSHESARNVRFSSHQVKN